MLVLILYIPNFSRHCYLDPKSWYTFSFPSTTAQVLKIMTKAVTILDGTAAVAHLSG